MMKLDEIAVEHYRSPVELIYDDFPAKIEKKYLEEIDNYVYMSIMKYPIVKVDREKLIQALDFDKERWIDGFREGVKMAKTWIKCSDKLPTDESCKIVTVWGSDIVYPKDGESLTEAMQRQMREIRRIDTACYDAKNKEWTGEYGFPLNPQPVAWMEFPEPYDEEK